MRFAFGFGSRLFSLGLVGCIALGACNTAVLQEPGQSSSGRSGSSGSSGGAASTIRIANFNTRNFFNDKDDSDTQLEETVDTTAAYQAHLAGVAGVLKQIEADVVVLVEVENQAVLDDLTARSELGGKYKYSALLPGNDPRGINIGVISALPIASTKTHKDDKIKGDNGSRQYQYARDLPEYHFEKDGHPFTLLGVHFKAKDVTASASQIAEDDDKRLAEGRGARAIADGLLADSANGPVLLLGDFNADTGEPSTQAVKGQNPAFDDAVSDRDEGDRWTVDYARQKMTYDDQWASPALADARDASSVVIVRNEVSDHAAVGATYTLGGE